MAWFFSPSGVLFCTTLPGAMAPPAGLWHRPSCSTVLFPGWGEVKTLGETPVGWSKIPGMVKIGGIGCVEKDEVHINAHDTW